VPKVVRIHLFKLCLRLALLMLTMAKVAVTQSAPASDYTHTIARIDRVALISITRRATRCRWPSIR
jgi:hypothetical protein